MSWAALLQRLLNWARSVWLGRVLVGSVTSFFRLEMFDRSMAIAAQLFTSVLPILILVATWGGSTELDLLGDSLDLPAQTQSVLEDAIAGAGSATIGLVGTIMLLASATSLSRALTRAVAAVWSVERPKSRLIQTVSRWLAVVLVLSLAFVLIAVVSEPLESLPPPGAWSNLLTFVTDAGLGLILPWLVLAGAVVPRRLAPGALTFAILMLAVRPATKAWFPPALTATSDRYGTIGVSFTYIALLYILAFCFLGSVVIGKVIATDSGGLGKWIRTGNLTHTDTPAGEST